VPANASVAAAMVASAVAAAMVAIRRIMEIPPDEFVQVVLRGGQPSSEHDQLIIGGTACR
ncbi:hypothetical protein ACFVQ4_20735, partial [Streptomyces laurentii]|uniref:hypothetical protein n=1 Tax=Streptomyces laurentii TaxID=39478 RepID=UPI0036BD7A6D